MKNRSSLQQSLNKLLSDQIVLSKQEFIILQKAGEWVIPKMNITDLHGFPHVLRVLNLCLKLQQAEGGDLFVLLLATLLHDVGRDYTSNNGSHEKKSAEMTKQFIDSHQIDLHKEVAEQIIHCILAHSFSAGKTAKFIEAKILSDADKIDALGAVGIYRAACFQYEHGTGLMAMYQHFFDKLLKLPSMMFTQTGKKVANKRVELMQIYIAQLEDELGLISTKME